jgi:hypothetical protein
VLTDEELAALIEVGVESRSIEFKGPGSTSSAEFVAVAARACIALANQRDGGHLVIGVVDGDPGGAAGGLTDSQLSEWMSYDTVVAKVNVYADPPLQLRLAERHLPNGNPVVVVEVAEFAEIPILSVKEFSGKIVRGQLYTRSMAKPESSAQNTQNELREVLALATEKQLQVFLRTARHAGLPVEASGPTDLDLFASEQTAFFQQPLAGVVAGEPRMVAVIRPETYQEDLLDYESLGRLVASNAVRLRGWPFPYVQRVVHGDRWVGEAQESMHPEVWALHQSGQFVDSRPLPLGYGPDSDGFTASSTGPYLPVWFPVMFIMEATVLAARLQRAAFASESLNVEFIMEGAQGWELVVADPSRGGFHGSYRFGSSRWKRSFTLEPNPIEDDIKNSAAEASRDLLLRFGWTGVTSEIVRGMQDEVLR